MQDVLDFLETTDMPYRLIKHPAVYHVGEEPSELDGLPSTKNLLLKDRSTGKVYMIVMEGEKRLDIARLAESLGATKSRLQFVRHENVEAIVGVPPGHVSVFNVLLGKAGAVTIIVDEALLHRPEVGFHPNVNTATVVIPSAMLPQLLAGLGVPFKLVALTS